MEDLQRNLWRVPVVAWIEKLDDFRYPLQLVRTGSRRGFSVGPTGQLGKENAHAIALTLAKWL